MGSSLFSLYRFNQVCAHDSDEPKKIRNDSDFFRRQNDLGQNDLSLFLMQMTRCNTKGFKSRKSK